MDKPRRPNVIRSWKFPRTLMRGSSLSPNECQNYMKPRRFRGRQEFTSGQNENGKSTSG